MANHDAIPTKTGNVGPAAAARVMAALTEDGDQEAEAGGAATGGPGRIDGFNLSRKLGEGGGGVVYLGYRDGSDRPLAIKVLNKRLGRDEPGGIGGGAG